MKALVAALVLFGLLFLAGCSESENTQLTGAIVSEAQAQPETVASQPEPQITCKDECSVDTCDGVKFVKCEQNADGCKHKIEIGLTIGKCGVQCLSDKDCGSNRKCGINYECTGPTIAEEATVSLKQQAKEGQVTRTLKGVTLSLKGIKYEVRGEDYAVINGIDFGIVNEGSESINPQIAVYLWDDNDPVEYRATEKTLLEVETFGLDNGEFVIKNATVRIPFNDINLTKHIKLSAIEEFSFNPKTFVSIEYDFDIK